MTEPTYSIVVRGDLLPGFTLADAKAGTARLFKAAPEAVEKLFSGRAVTVRRNLPRHLAMKTVAALEGVGLKAVMQSEAAADDLPPPAPRAQADAPIAHAASGGLTLAPMEGNLVKAGEIEKPAPVQVAGIDATIAPAGSDLGGTATRSEPTPQIRVPDWELSPMESAED
ncbi:hypothetical protein [Biformimicrobium ophioploci]|uniref:Uncharacterized protein n=1 Tax=Biformimicrobium ophioploci TaxID=3036711 RepID=A0ABQ6LWE5_9GAMM|nr:hypothetical protein [Microbulbifer sp. NKW57]GMG86439.1 hypothetical protein MNKW57_07600 [Microbulbifer sp. NKW57]